MENKTIEYKNTLKELLEQIQKASDVQDPYLLFRTLEQAEQKEQLQLHQTSKQFRVLQQQCLRADQQ